MCIRDSWTGVPYIRRITGRHICPAGAFYEKAVRGSDMTATFRQQMDRESGLLGIRLSEKPIEQFFTYYEMLVEKNKVMNLTAITCLLYTSRCV